jgi:hypothetical protein
MSKHVFSGPMPARMTPCRVDHRPDFEALSRTAHFVCALFKRWQADRSVQNV